MDDCLLVSLITVSFRAVFLTLIVLEVRLSHVTFDVKFHFSSIRLILYFNFICSPLLLHFGRASSLIAYLTCDNLIPIYFNKRLVQY